MSDFITEAFVEQFRDNLLVLAQQKGSKLRPYVRESSVTGEAWNVERIGATAARKRASRHSDSPLMATPHDRRKGYVFDYDWGDLVDDEDKARLLIEPTSAYALLGAYAMGRAMDDEIIAAATGNAYDESGVAITLPSAQKVAVNYVETGSAANSNLTIAKLRRASEILGVNDIDDDLPRIMVVTQSQITSLLRTTEVTSSDFNAVKALVEGKVNTFMGFDFVRTQRLAKSSNTRTCFGMITGPEGPMELGVGRDMKTRITERSDKNFAVYVFHSMTIGAARAEDEKIVEIACDESA